MESIVVIGFGVLSLRMFIQLADLLYDDRKLLPMLPLSARSIACLTSVAFEKSDSSEMLSQMAGDESGERYTWVGGRPLGTGVGTGTTGGVLGRIPAGSKLSSGGCSSTEVEATHDMVL